MRILVTGFEPFGAVQANPSQMIVQRLAERNPDLLTLVLPTEYRAAADKIRAAIESWEPDAVVSLGVAQNRTQITLERVALNLDDASIPDNSGALASGDPIEAEGPLAYPSTLPIQRMLAALKAREIPAAISNHAGTYVCNHVFYSVRHWVEGSGRDIPCGFIHVPGLPSATGDGAQGMPLEQMIAAVEICLAALSPE
ncbi:MAG: pyroglutamyl-peptidase I [Chloroflexi bacterium]|nr:pyroglutamyl-peptidase I [Chloroflexota bacterium]